MVHLKKTQVPYVHLHALPCTSPPFGYTGVVFFYINQKLYAKCLLEFLIHSNKFLKTGRGSLEPWLIIASWSVGPEFKAGVRIGGSLEICSILWVDGGR